MRSCVASLAAALALALPFRMTSIILCFPALCTAAFLHELRSPGSLATSPGREPCATVRGCPQRGVLFQDRLGMSHASLRSRLDLDLATSLRQSLHSTL